MKNTDDHDCEDHAQQTDGGEKCTYPGCGHWWN